MTAQHVNVDFKRAQKREAALKGRKDKTLSECAPSLEPHWFHFCYRLHTVLGPDCSRVRGRNLGESSVWLTRVKPHGQICLQISKATKLLPHYPSAKPQNPFKTWQQDNLFTLLRELEEHLTVAPFSGQHVERKITWNPAWETVCSQTDRPTLKQAHELSAAIHQSIHVAVIITGLCVRDAGWSRILKNCFYSWILFNWIEKWFQICFNVSDSSTCSASKVFVWWSGNTALHNTTFRRPAWGRNKQSPPPTPTTS